MTSVSNIVLCRGPSLSMKGFARAASRIGRRGNSANIFQRGLCTGISTMTAEDGTQRRSLSTFNTARNHRFLGVENSNSIPSSSAQRRLRSALPDEYYDDDDEVAVSSMSTTRASKPFLLADIGEGIAEVELLRWFVEEGQVISEFDPVCEVQSDKATVEITSRYDGKVEKLAYSSTGNMIKVGDPIMWILKEECEEQIGQDQQQHGKNSLEEEISTNTTDTTTATASLSAIEDHSSSPQTKDVSAIAQESKLVSETKHQVQNVDSSTDISNTVLTSPAVRKLARDHGLNLSTINGTGPSGRILKGDILAVLQESNSSLEVQENSNTSISGNEIHRNSESNHSISREDEVVPLRGYNRIMADTMTASLKIPHMVYSDEINLNRFVKYKMEQQQLNNHNHPEENSKKLLFLPLAIKAASKALEKYPWLNASFNEEKCEATLWKDHNIGIAMDTPRGLIVPVMKECQNKSLPELAEEVLHLKSSVVEGVGGLPAKDLQGATFTLSNVGTIGGGGTYMSPIITPPQVAIGALGQIRRLPRFVTPNSTDPAQSQTIEEVHICAVSWAADHRVVDGATMARFHKAFKEYMEDPIKLLLELR